MGWLELLAWVKAMRTQNEGKTTSPDSWDNVDVDPWWQEQRRERERKRQERIGR